MILQSLASYYDRLATNPESGCAPEGFSRERAHFALVIGKDGRLAQVLDLRQQAGRKQVPADPPPERGSRPRAATGLRRTTPGQTGSWQPWCWL